MKVTKNSDTYIITLSEEEAENVMKSLDLYPSALAYNQIKMNLQEAKQKGKSERPLETEFYI